MSEKHLSENHLETATAFINSLVNEEKTMAFIKPTLGPACISVELMAADGSVVPVCAFLSSSSWVTVMPMALANRLGAPYSKTRSNAFRCILDSKSGKSSIPDVHLVKELTVKVDSTVTVTLRSAVCLPDFDRFQLGKDFFTQALRASIDVYAGDYCEDEDKLGDSVAGFVQIKSLAPNPVHAPEPETRTEHMMLTVQPSMGSDFLSSTRSTAGGTRREELRYHAADGASAMIPIFHWNDWNYDEKKDDMRFQFRIFLLPAKTKVDTCDWCGRLFPALMQCSVCRAQHVRITYCSKSCQRQGWPQHKLTSPHSGVPAPEPEPEAACAAVAEPEPELEVEATPTPADCDSVD